jgi:hypothetical protein
MLNRCALNFYHIGGGRSLWASFDVKGHLVTFFKRFKAGSLNGREMHENVISLFLLNKTETLLIAKPLYDSCCQLLFSLSSKKCSDPIRGTRSKENILQSAPDTT